MTSSKISPIFILISSIIFAILGVVTLINPRIIENLIHNIAFIFTLFMGIISITGYLFDKNKKNIQELLRGVLYIILALIIKKNLILLGISISLMVGIYALMNFTAQIISTVLLYESKASEWKFSLINTIISLTFGLILIFHPIKSKELLTNIAGIYLVLYSITLLRDFIREIFDTNKIKNNVKRKVRVRLPIIYTAFVPQKLLERINESLQTEDFEEKDVYVQSKVMNTDPKGELEVFIHLGKDCANGFGHIDICYKDTIYCYGNYDDKSKKFFATISDGLLIEVGRSNYIDFITKKRHLVSFVLSLNNEQCKAVEDKIEEIKSNTYTFKCDSEKNQNTENNDYLSELYSETNAKYYKFKHGYFKTYFVLITNCVKLSDTIIGAAGLDAVSLNGIISPGVYYNYLNRLFNMKNTIVISKNIYNKIE